MISLVLDQSTTIAGWAVLDDKTLKDHGRINLKGKKIRERIDQLLKDVQELISLFRPDEMVIEETRYVRQPSADVNMAMNATYYMLRNLAEDYGLSFHTQVPASIKKGFTGKGNATKPEMIAKATEVIGVAPLCDNHADAIGAAIVWSERSA